MVTGMYPGPRMWLPIPTGPCRAVLILQRDADGTARVAAMTAPARQRREEGGPAVEGVVPHVTPSCAVWRATGRARSAAHAPGRTCRESALCTRRCMGPAGAFAAAMWDAAGLPLPITIPATTIAADTTPSDAIAVLRAPVRLAAARPERGDGVVAFMSVPLVSTARRGGSN